MMLRYSKLMMIGLLLFQGKAAHAVVCPSLSAPATLPTNVLSHDSVINMADVEIGQNGRSAAIPIEIADDVIGMTIELLGSNKGIYLVEELKANGTTYVSDHPEGIEISDTMRQHSFKIGQILSLNRSATQPFGGFGILQVPNNGRFELRAGKGEFVIGGYNAKDLQALPGKVYVRTVFRHLPKKLESTAHGHLKLNLFFTGSKGWAANKFCDLAEFQELFTTVRAIFSDASIELEIANATDIDKSFARPAAGTQLFSELFSNSEFSEGLNIYFVDNVPLGAGAVGVSRGIPGPMLSDQKFNNGIAVAVSDDRITSVSEIAKTLAHELGHTLGLFHTTDIVGGAVLPHQIDDAELSANNLMFPDSAAPWASFSPIQSAVMRRSPFVTMVR